jgi:hypothetical protein
MRRDIVYISENFRVDFPPEKLIRDLCAVFFFGYVPLKLCDAAQRLNFKTSYVVLT